MSKENRKNELLKLIDHDITLTGIVDEVIFLEGRLEELKMLPHLKYNPKNMMQQKPTPAAKQYKENLQQYANLIKIIARATGTDENDEESPLRKWVNARRVDLK